MVENWPENDTLHLVLAEFLRVEALEPLLEALGVRLVRPKSTPFALSMTASSTKIGACVRSASAIASLGRASIAIVSAASST